MSWNDWVVAIMKGCDSNSVVISAHNGGICGKSESLEFDRLKFVEEIKIIREIGQYVEEKMDIFVDNRVKTKPERIPIEITTSPSNYDPFSILPKDICFEIASFVDTESLLSCSCVSKKWQEIFSNEKVWWLCFCKRFGTIEPQFGKLSPSFWKHIYKMHINKTIKCGNWAVLRIPPNPTLPSKSSFTICGRQFYLVHRNEFIFGMRGYKEGVIIFKTVKTYLIAFINIEKFPGSPGNAARVLGINADVLIKNGY